MAIELSTTCPYCGIENDTAGEITPDTTPGDGDFSLPGNLRKPTGSEMIEILNDPEIMRLEMASMLTLDPHEAVRLTREADVS